MIGLWNGSVTSRYSSTGSNTLPPRTFSARSCAWCLCSLATSTAKEARSCGWPESTTWFAELITATAIGPRASSTRRMSSSAWAGRMPFTESIGVASPYLRTKPWARASRVPAAPMSAAMARISSICGRAASIEPASMMACAICTPRMPCEWPSKATGFALASV